MNSSSTMQINPDIKECFVLRGWYDTDGSGHNFKSYSTTNATPSSAGFNRSELRALDEIKQAGYGMPGQPEYFSARGTVMHIKSEGVSYPACPNDGCSKKVEEVGGLWRCEKCDQSFDAPKHRYVCWSLSIEMN
jgi:replication factor A1